MVSRRAAANNAKVIGDSSGLVGSVPANGLTKLVNATVNGLTASGGVEIPVITGVAGTD
jgi:hypothetical protein